MAKKNEKEEIKEDKKEILLTLLKRRIPQTLEREPAAAYTPELEKLADEIINLLN